MSSKHVWAKKFLGGIGLLFLALLTASCGGGGSNSSSTPPAATGTVVITGSANQ